MNTNNDFFFLLHSLYMVTQTQIKEKNDTSGPFYNFFCKDKDCFHRSAGVTETPLNNPLKSADQSGK